MNETTMTIVQAQGLINSQKATAAAAKATAEAAVKSSEAEHKALLEAVGVQKYFKRARVGKDHIGDATQYFEMIRLNADKASSIGQFPTTGLAVESGVKIDSYTLGTLLTLELSSAQEFNDVKALLKA